MPRCNSTSNAEPLVGYSDRVHELEIVGLRVDLPANTPVVLLRELGGDQRLLPILIGHPEAFAINSALEGIEPPRPMTHDLLLAVVKGSARRIERVVITEVRDHTFYAELHLGGAGGEFTVSCRPSDGIALAVRCECPVYATAALLDAAALPAEAEEQAESEVDVEAAVDEFRGFLDDVRPEDFGR